MKSIELTKEEKEKSVFFTLGCLKVAIGQIYGDDERTARAQNLLDKIINDVSNMDIEINHLKSEIAELKLKEVV